MKINGLANMPFSQLQFEVQNGAKFVQYFYCISLLVVTFRRGTDLYFIKAGESALVPGLPLDLVEFCAGLVGHPVWPYLHGAVDLSQSVRWHRPYCGRDECLCRERGKSRWRGQGLTAGGRV